MNKNISDYMAIVINENSNIDYLGYLFNYSFHANCVNDYIKLKYPDEVKKVEQIDDQLAPFYFLTHHNKVIFTNISTDDEKRGMIFFPDRITAGQKQSLDKLIKEISDYHLDIVYNLTMYDDFVMGDEFQSDALNNKDLVNKFITYNEKINSKQKGR